MTLVTGAFAQGKISFQTDNNHLVYFDPATPGVGGQAVNSTIAPVPLSADLYIGTSSGSLSLYSSTTFFNSSNPGKWNTVSVQTLNPFILGGTSVFVVTQVRDSAATAATTLDASQLANGKTYAASLGYGWYGWSQEFTFTLGSSTTYPAMYNSPTWTAGTFDLSSSVGAGAKGAIAVAAVPEPTSLALAGLGIAAGLIMRRRK